MKTQRVKDIGRVGLSCTLCLILLIIGVFMSTNISAETKGQHPVNCDIQEGPCTLYLSGHKVTLDILPKPVKAMKDLKFRVTLSGEQLSSAPHIELGMPGMKMGPNRVDLKALASSSGVRAAEELGGQRSRFLIWVR